MTAKSDNGYLLIPLAEMQKTFDLQLASFDTIKTQSRALFSSASLLVALVSALQIFSNTSFPPEWLPWYRAGLVLAGLLYVALIVLCSLALWPAAPVLPIDAKWEELATTFKGLSEQDRLLKHLSGVLNAIDLNRPLVKRYTRFSKAATLIFPLIVITLLLLALIPRI
jgi:hypothetical protein